MTPGRQQWRYPQRTSHERDTILSFLCNSFNPHKNPLHFTDEEIKIGMENVNDLFTTQVTQLMSDIPGS